MSVNSKEKILFIVGPTAVGKSEVAVKLAEKLNAQIISCDSMQIYKAMDIITSKPKCRLTKKIAHHLIDSVSPDREYNVSQYRREAQDKIKRIIKNGKVPLLVGGTGLYMSVLVDGIFDLKAGSKAMRKKLYNQLEREGSESLYRELKEVDARAAERIHPNDAKRIIRALEVFKTCGNTISFLQKQRTGLSRDYDIKIFCLNMDRDELYKRIDKRVERMFREGLLDEVRRLLRLKLSKTAAYAIGIREIKGYLEGLYDLKEAKRLIKRNTRAYAKRQLTWFRKDKRITWLDVGAKESPQSVADRILKEIN